MEAGNLVNVVRAAIVALVVLWSACASAAGYTVTWGYTPPSSPAVTGYRLYCNGVVVTDFMGATIAEGTVSNGVLVIGDSFTLTAIFDDLTESPASAPYIWTGAAIAIRRMLNIKAGNTHGKTTGPGHVLVQ